ncbi:MAG: hypothetical protein L3J84_00260 [Gammaproteobacteria bacterium]|nr:hypothetical protein [Gammaproteobacteria bacterium]
MKKLTLISVITTLLVSMSAVVQASEGHDHGHDDGHSNMSGMKHDDHHDGHSSAGHDEKGMPHKKGEMFLVKKEVDGYDVSFHIMKAKAGKEMGGSHDFMIKVEKNGKALDNITMNTKVVHPNGKEESKKVMKMGDWYMAGYDLGHEGKHQMMILFKTKDGQKHKAGIYY